MGTIVDTSKSYVKKLFPNMEVEAQIRLAQETCI